MIGLLWSLAEVGVYLWLFSMPEGSRKMYSAAWEDRNRQMWPFWLLPRRNGSMAKLFT